MRWWIKIFISLSVQHGRAYTVVRAITSHSYGDSEIHGCHSSKTDWHKIWCWRLRRRYHLSCQNPKWSPHWGSLGIWLKYHSCVVCSFLWPKILLASRNYITNFYTVWYIWCQFWVIAGKKCINFLFSPIITPPPPKKGAWIGIFKPKTQHIQTFILLKLQKAIPTKFCTVIKTTKIFPTNPKSADGRHLKKDKLLYLSNSLTDINEILHWPSRP